MAEPGPGAIVAVGEVQNASNTGFTTAIVAAGDVRMHLPPAEELLAIKKLATQTKAIGVILPPPDIRAIIDKTAQFVAKHGACAAGGWVRRCGDLCVTAMHARAHRVVCMRAWRCIVILIVLPVAAQARSSRSAFWAMRRTM